jgi:hypothetical protein
MNAIQDSSGNTSSMRVFMLAWAIMMICLVVYLTLLNGKFPEIPVGLASITGGILFGKLIQNSQENKNDRPT